MVVDQSVCLPVPGLSGLVSVRVWSVNAREEHVRKRAHPVKSTDEKGLENITGLV